MNELLLVIIVNANDAPLCENMLTWLYNLSGREKRGHVLLCFDWDVSDEMRMRVKISADLGFVGVTELIVPKPEKPQSEICRRNNLFLAAALKVQTSYRWQWLLIEGGCVPTNQDWMANIAKEYFSQPAKYLGCHLKPTAESSDRFMNHIGVYPVNAHYDMAQMILGNMENPFEQVCGMQTVSRSAKSRSIQPLKILDESHFSMVWPEAQIVVGDISGALIEFYRENGIHLPKQPTVEEKSRILDFYGTAPDKLLKTAANLLPAISAKPDLRTKEGRAWKAAHANGNGHTQKV